MIKPVAYISSEPRGGVMQVEQLHLLSQFIGLSDARWNKATMVELLAAYSNTGSGFDQSLESLSSASEHLGGDAKSASSPPRKVRSPLPNSIISKIVADYQAGASRNEIARAYDIPRTSVLNVLQRAGISRPPKRITDDEVDAANKLILEGKSVLAAATELDIAVRSLYHQLRVRGLPTRPT